MRGLNLKRDPKYKAIYGEGEDDLSNLPYVDDRRNEVSPEKPQKADINSYAEKGENPLLAYLESIKPERDEDKEKQLKKSAAVNTIGEMLRNVIDVHYGKKGATISKRESENPAFDRLQQTQEQFREDESDYNDTYLNALMKDMNMQRQDEYRAGQNQRQDERWADQDTESLRKEEQGIKEFEARNKLAKEREARLRGSGIDDTEDTFYTVKNQKTKKDVGLTISQFDDVINALKLNMKSFPNDQKVQDLGLRGETLGDDARKDLVFKYWDQFYTDENGRAVPKKGGNTAFGGYEAPEGTTIKDFKTGNPKAEDQKEDIVKKSTTKKGYAGLQD